MKYVMMSLLLAFVLIGCDDSSDDGLTQHMAEESSSYAWSVDGVEILTVSNINGAMSVRAADGDSIRAEVTFSCTADTEAEAEDHLADIEFSDLLLGNRLQLEIDLPSNSNCDYNVNFDIMVPADVDLNITGVNGLIDVAGFASVMSLGLVNGSILCEMDAVIEEKDIYAATTNGGIELSIPMDSDVEFDLAVINGSLVITGFTDIVYTRNESRRKLGTIGDGLSTITLGTVNGTIGLIGQ